MGYAWKPSQLTIHVGDIVQWEWTTPYYLSDNIGYRVEETVNATATSAVPDGFSSGPRKTSNGMYLLYQGYFQL